MKEQHDNTKQRTKKALMLLSFTVSLFALFLGIVVASNWYQFRPYRSLASELNETLGGGYKISYRWNCGIETTNCPSVRMIKEVSLKSNEEARELVEGYKKIMIAGGYTGVGMGICSSSQTFRVYCSLEAKKENRVIILNVKDDFIGVDIE